MSPARPRATVVVGGTLNALSIARSLGARGVPVDVLADETKPVAARWSRHCRRYVAVEPPVQEAWLAWLLEGDCEPSVLLAGSDEALELIARNRDRLRERGHLPGEANDELVVALLDKARTYTLAAENGVAAPRALLLETVADVEHLDESFRYPAVLKARVSHHFARRFDPVGKGRTVRSHLEARDAAKPMVADGVSMLLTELVEGPHHAYCSYYTYLDEHGEPLVHATKRKLRQFPVGYGEGTFHQMADEPEAAAIGLRFFRAVGLRGIGNVEFKRDVRDGQLKLIECNLRFTQADTLLRRAGIDLPLLAYSRLVGWPAPRFAPQHNGLHLWVPGNDLRALRDYRRTGEMTGTAWLRSLSWQTTLPLLDPADLAPSTRDLQRRMRGIGSKVRKAARPEPARAADE